jgi:hypothetical protein
MTTELAYRAGVDRLAPSQLPSVPEGRPTNEEAIKKSVAFGEVFWKILLEVVSFWTPRRIQEEALRRAADAPGLSALSEEVHLLTEHYLRWLNALLDWEHAESKVNSTVRGTGFRRTILLKAMVGEALQKLEQRSSAVEAMALDLRFRVDHQRLLSAIAGNEFVSQIFDAIKEATGRVDSGEHIKALAQKLDLLENIEKRFGKVEGEIIFIADRLMADFAKNDLKTTAQSAAAELAKAATYGPVKAVLGELVKRALFHGP